MDLETTQVSLENHMSDLGHLRYSERKASLEKRGEGSSIKANLKVTQAVLPAIIRSLQSWATSNTFEGRGKRHSALLPLTTLGLEKPSGIGVVSCFNLLNQPLRRVLIMIGRAIESELLFTHLQEVDCDVAQRLFKFQKGNGFFRRVTALNRHQTAVAWTDSKRCRIAEPVLNAVLSTGLFQLTPQGGRKEMVITLTEEGRTVLHDLEDRFAWAKPMFLPMVTEPLPWTSQTDGGYRTSRGRRYTRLVKTRDPGQRASLAVAMKSGQAAPFVAGVNALQATPWQIDETMLDLVKWTFEEGLGDGLKKFPTKTHVPAYKMPEDPQPLNFRDARKVHETNMAIDADFAVFRNDVETAEFLTDFPCFYLPHNADKRGRVYPIPHFNFQRSDHIKAMFRFAEGKPLGERGLHWLMVHLANCGDFEKVSKKSFNDRIEWVGDYIHRIRAAAYDPKVYHWWMEADKPFCFLAACKELVAALDSPCERTYVSHLPVALDGSNSGLQHYSMALRSEDEGRMVCLASLEAPEDVYRLVAEASATLVREEVQSSPIKLLEALKAKQPKPEKETPAEYEERMAVLATKTRLAGELWLEYGIDRGTVKRNVMTFGYSSETFGFREQLMEDLMNPLSEKVLRGQAPNHPLEIDGDGGWFASLYLAKKNWAAVTSLIQSGAAGMQWLKRAAQLLAHEGKPVCWTTPTGFPCRNVYTEIETVTVELFLFDKSLTLSDPAVGRENDGDLYRTVRTSVADRGTETIIKSKSASTIAPNVIHSMDASHLLLTANAAIAQGIKNFQFIHDSFATHAGDTEVFFWLIRDTLVDMYEGIDLFGSLHEQVDFDLSEEGRAKLPPPPPTGTLDMDAVRKSLYSFA